MNGSSSVLEKLDASNSQRLPQSAVGSKHGIVSLTHDSGGILTPDGSLPVGTSWPSGDSECRPLPGLA